MSLIPEIKISDWFKKKKPRQSRLDSQIDEVIAGVVDEVVDKIFPDESSKTIEEIADLNREALSRLGYLLFTPKTIENILTRLSIEHPNTDPKLFETLKHDLGIK